MTSAGTAEAVGADLGVRIGLCPPRFGRSPRNFGSGFLIATWPFSPLPKISPRLIQTFTPILPYVVLASSNA